MATTNDDQHQQPTCHIARLPNELLEVVIDGDLAGVKFRFNDPHLSMRMRATPGADPTVVVSLSFRHVRISTTNAMNAYYSLLRRGGPGTANNPGRLALALSYGSRPDISTMPRALKMLSFLPALRSFTADDISSCVNAVRILADYPSVVRISLASAQLDAARVRYLLERKPGLQSLHAVNIALVRQWAVSPIWSLGIGMHEVDVNAALSLVGREVRELSEMALPDQYGKPAALEQDCVARHCPNLRTLKLLHHLKVEPPVLDALPATLEGCPKLDSLELISALPLHIATLYRVRDAGPYISFFLSSSSLVNLSIVESHSIPSHWAAEPSDLLYVLAAYAPTNQPQRSITLDPPLRRWHRRESVRWREEDAAPVIALAKEKGIELTITSL